MIESYGPWQDPLYVDRRIFYDFRQLSEHMYRDPPGGQVLFHAGKLKSLRNDRLC